jgi:ABC-type uncharacterized transport system substrate-binding protein
MQRRKALAIFGGAAVVLPLAGRAQQRPIPVIGFLSTLGTTPEFLDAFRKGLAETGYHENRNVKIEYRSAEGDYGRLPTLAAELVRYPVDVIVTTGGGLSGVGGEGVRQPPSRL